MKCFARHIRKISTTKTCIFLFSFTGQLESTDLFNLELLPSSQDHYRQLLPRFGHSLSTDSQGTLWVFGGYSFTQGGPLNDIRAFDTKNVSWLPITVHFTVSYNLFFPWNHFHENFREIWFHGKFIFIPLCEIPKDQRTLLLLWEQHRVVGVAVNLSASELA